jgi:hypothetical protein
MDSADFVSWGHQDAKKCLESFIMLNIESNPTKYTRVAAGGDLSRSRARKKGVAQASFVPESPLSYQRIKRDSFGKHLAIPCIDSRMIGLET